MPDTTKVELGKVQQTLFFPLLSRAQETESRRPLLRDPKALEVLRAVDFPHGTYRTPMRFLVVIRTMILDWWIRQFFADTDRRRMLAASLLDEDWLGEVEALPGPYFFVADGALPYLTEEQVTSTLARLATRFPGSKLAFDSYPQVALEWEHKMAAKRDLAFWQWSCDDPRTLERFGLRLLESVTSTRPPAGFVAELPLRYRSLLPLAHPFLGRGQRLSLFETAPAS